MNTYENSYFQLRIGFPDDWKLTSWRHSKIDRSRRAAYQSRDDDLPKKGASKFLFAAALYSTESKALVDADIEMSVFRLAPEEDMRASLVENFERQRDFYKSNGITTSITQEGVWTIDSVDFDYIDQESKSGSGLNRYRFLFRPMEDGLWLYGKIAGHKKPAFDKALRIVGDMKCSGGGGC